MPEERREGNGLSWTLDGLFMDSFLISAILMREHHAIETIIALTREELKKISYLFLCILRARASSMFKTRGRHCCVSPKVL